MRQNLRFWWLCVLVLFSTIGYGANLPPGFNEVLVAQGLDPTAMTLAPDGRIFLCEKNGRVLIVENGKLLSSPLCVVDVDTYNERGLSGIALHPDFEQNGYFYLYYTVKDAGHNRVSRFTADGNFSIPGSEMVLMDLDSLRGTVHNAGSMAFGPDGKLYISVGDGSNAPKVQLMTSVLGKILRINDDGSIPEDNPFYNQTSGIYRAIYALGFRNSFSMAIQPGTGRIMATEVGSASWEEVNDILPGMNYGWPIIEGPLEEQNPPENYKEPVFTYAHTDGCAAVGAAFYNPEMPMFPQEYLGKFFFADYCNGYIKYLDPDAPGTPQTFATQINRPLNLLVAPDGTMYYLARAGIGGGSEEDNTSSANGSLWRIVYTGSGAPFVAANPQSVLVPVGENVTFTTQVSGVQPLTYQWQRDSLDIPGANAVSYFYQNAMLSDSGSVFRCIIRNQFGADTTQWAELRVTSNQRPVPEITSPEEGTVYRAGQVLQFAGVAVDPEQGALDSTELRWRIDFHHNAHTHPALAPTTGLYHGSYVIPQVGETADNVWYRVYLTAADNRGLTKTVYRDIYPVKTEFNVHSVPSGLPIYVESDYLPTPVTIKSVVGIIRRLEAPLSFIQGDSILIFREWSIGSTDNVLAFAAEDDTVTYTAIYDTYPRGEGNGLTGYYYAGQPWDPTFYEPYAFSRLDKEINFDWGEGSPSEELLGNDFWLVRWEGFIQPFVNDTYTFHLISDDGARMWVDDQLVVDSWFNHPVAEWSGSISLQGGEYYPIRVEYFESGGGAICQLHWSGNRFIREVVPQTQLYTESPAHTSDESSYPVNIYPNPASDEMTIEIHDLIDGTVSVEVRNMLGQICIQRELTLASGRAQLRVDGLADGVYLLDGIASRKKITTTPFVKSK